MHRVLFLDHTPFVGGAQLALLDHVRHLDGSRFEAQIACSASVPSLVDQFRGFGTRTHLVDWPRLRQPTPATIARVISAGVRLRKIIRDEHIDLVVANTSRTAYIASLSLLGSSIPLIWWVRDFDFGRRWFDLLAGVPRRFVCVSNAVRDFYGGANNSKFSVVPVGNDLHDRLAAYDVDQIRASRASWGVEPGDVVIGYMGRLVEGKGPEDVLSAFELLRPDFPELRLMIVGTGKGQEGDVEAKLHARVTEAGLNAVVRFTGHQTEDALYYQMFDIFVLSSRYPDAMSISVVQAMMAGKPVIATRTGGTPEVVVHDETGILVPPRQPKAMADALRGLLLDPGSASAMARAAQTRVMSRHRQDFVTREVERVYSSLLPTAQSASGVKLATSDAAWRSAAPQPVERHADE